MGSRQSTRSLPPCLRRSRIKAPSLGGHYPARGFPVGACAPPTGLPVLHPLPCACMPSAIPRRRRPAMFRIAPNLAVPVAGSLPRDPGRAASSLTVSRPARHSHALRPARSLSRPRRPSCIEVLQSIWLPPRTAPIATGWNETTSRAGLPSAGVRCLSTAHEIHVICAHCA